MRPLPLIIILTVLNHIAFNGSRVTMALYAIHFNASALTVGTLMALYALLPALLSVTAGRWVDRIGVDRPMWLGSCILGIGMALPFLLPGLMTLYVAAALIGVSFMLINVTAYHAVGAMSTAQDRPVNFSYVALGFSISSFIAPMLSGITIDNLGHRAAFLVLGLFTLFPIVALGLRLVPLPESEIKLSRPTNSKIFDLFQGHELRRLFVIMAILTVSWDVYNFAIPIYGHGIGLSASQIGMVMGAFAAATFTVRLAMPFIATRIAPWTMLTASLVIAGLSFCVLPFASNIIVLMLLMFMLGLGLGAPQPIVLTLLHEAAPNGRAGEALGLRTTLINTSQTVMPLLFGAVGATLGLNPVFWSMAVILGVGSYFAKRHSPHRKP